VDQLSAITRARIGNGNRVGTQRILLDHSRAGVFVQQWVHKIVGAKVDASSLWAQKIDPRAAPTSHKLIVEDLFRFTLSSHVSRPATLTFARHNTIIMTQHSKLILVQPNSIFNKEYRY